MKQRASGHRSALALAASTRLQEVIPDKPETSVVPFYYFTQDYSPERKEGSNTCFAYRMSLLSTVCPELLAGNKSCCDFRCKI